MMKGQKRAPFFFKMSSAKDLVNNGTSNETEIKIFFKPRIDRWIEMFKYAGKRKLLQFFLFLFKTSVTN